MGSAIGRVLMSAEDARGRFLGWFMLYTDDLATMISPCYLEQKEGSVPLLLSVFVLYL